MDRWNALSHPPATALRQIQAGRLKGKTDINPMWRYQAMTEQFGPCGIGWKYTIDRLWTEPGEGCQVCAFALVSLYVRDEPDQEFGDAVPGIGGSMLIVQESNGIHTSDEAYKMAVTDALSVAMKMLGVGAAIYAGAWDGIKYRDTPATAPERPQDASTPSSDTRHAEPSKGVNAEGTGVNAGASRVKDGPVHMTAVIATEPRLKHIDKLDQDVVEFDADEKLADGQISAMRVKVTAWHQGRDFMLSPDAPGVGAYVDITGRWKEYRGSWSIDTNDICDGIPF